jgi:hypothetical protein
MNHVLDMKKAQVSGWRLSAANHTLGQVMPYIFFRADLCIKGEPKEFLEELHERKEMLRQVYVKTDALTFQEWGSINHYLIMIQCAVEQFISDKEKEKKNDGA